MKKLFIFSVLSCMVLTASAQFTNTGAGSNSSKKSSVATQTDIPDSYRSFYLQYNGQKSGETLTGVAIGFNSAKKIAEGTPLYFEFGLAAQYSSKDELKMASLRLPLDLTYRIYIPDSKFYVSPLVGVDLKGHLWGEYDEYNIFDEDDMGDYAYKRFQVGWHAGCRFGLGGCYLGFQYGTDFMDLVDGADKVKTTSITLGFDL